MDTIQRLREIVTYSGLSVRAFAMKCGIAQNTMSYYLSGQRKPSYEAVDKILLAFPDLSSEWLTRGRGVMLLSQLGNTDRQLERMNKLVDTIATLQDTINAQRDTIALLKEQNSQLKTQLKIK